MEFFNQMKANWNMFLNGGYKDVYRMIFTLPQFPIFSTVQAVFACFVVHKSFINKKRSVIVELKKLIISFLMTFGSRELFAYLFRKQSPIQHYPVSVGIFFGVYVLMNFAPGDFIYKLCGVLFYFLGLAHGFDQTRYFTLILRQLKPYQEFAGHKALPVAIVFAVLDQVIETLLRLILRGDDSKLCNTGSVVKTGFSMALYWACVNENYFTQWLRLRDQQMSALVLGLALGMVSTMGKIAGDVVKPVNVKPKQPETQQEEKKVEEVKDEKKKVRKSSVTKSELMDKMMEMKKEMAEMKKEIAEMRKELNKK